MAESPIIKDRLTGRKQYYIRSTKIWDFKGCQTPEASISPWAKERDGVCNFKSGKGKSWEGKKRTSSVTKFSCTTDKSLKGKSDLVYLPSWYRPHSNVNFLYKRGIHIHSFPKLLLYLPFLQIISSKYSLGHRGLLRDGKLCCPSPGSAGEFLLVGRQL